MRGHNCSCTAAAESEESALYRRMQRREREEMLSWERARLEDSAPIQVAEDEEEEKEDASGED